jgi:toxin ParE1/3/4
MNNKFFKLKNKAYKDLLEIGRYTHKVWGLQQRNKYLKEIDACFCLLATMPEQGQMCDEIRSGYRKFLIKKHIIFYRELKSGNIEIVRILHSSMDVEIHIPKKNST